MTNDIHRRYPRAARRVLALHRGQLRGHVIVGDHFAKAAALLTDAGAASADRLARAAERVVARERLRAVRGVLRDELPSSDELRAAAREDAVDTA